MPHLCLLAADLFLFLIEPVLFLFWAAPVLAFVRRFEGWICGRDTATEARRLRRDAGRRVEVTPLIRRCRASAWTARTARPDEEDAKTRGAGW